MTQAPWNRSLSHGALALAVALGAAACSGHVDDGPAAAFGTNTGGQGGGAVTPPDRGSVVPTPDRPVVPTPDRPVVPTPSRPDDAPVPYAPLPAHVYVGKVKNLLTGLPPTADELAALNADPRGLPQSVDKWSATPEFRARMTRFFKQAFQQTQTDIRDYAEVSGMGGLTTISDRNLLVASLEASFARTVLALMDEGKPFTETVTTDRFMLNPPLMTLLAYMDAVPRNDTLKVVAAAVWPDKKFPGLTMTLTQNIDPVTGMPTPIPLAETLDPLSPNFLTFYDAKPYVGNAPERCSGPHVVTGTAVVPGVLDMFFGRSRPGGCGNTTPVFTAEDWDDWRMVRIRKPRADEERTLFWDIFKLRNPATKELVLDTPRVGFMTTLAFFANWPTNDSNASRVTTNQALIVGLGRSFDDRGTTVQVTETSLDSQHLEPGSTCFACHQTLDPMRDFFRQSYAVSYYQQLAPQNPKNVIPAIGTFAVDGAPAVRGSGIVDFAKAMAAHPRFAIAWTQKLCEFANATSCDEEDPEFKRVAAAFANSKFQFRTLVRELFSSPLVTFAKPTKTSEATGVVISIARREAFCSSLEGRLGVKNICGFEGPTNAKFSNLALAIPGGAYVRGEVQPLLPHDPTMFFVSAAENLCTLLAPMLVDAGATSRWTVAGKEQALNDFVGVVMGLPAGDPRSAEMRGLLASHVDETTKPAGAREALRSAFVVACTSPFSISLGL